jgi:hypothetical protein
MRDYLNCKYLLNKLKFSDINNNKLFVGEWMIHIEIFQTVKVLHILLIKLERPWWIIVC